MISRMIGNTTRRRYTRSCSLPCSKAQGSESMEGVPAGSAGGFGFDAARASKYIIAQEFMRHPIKSPSAFYLQGRHALSLAQNHSFGWSSLGIAKASVGIGVEGSGAAAARQQPPSPCPMALRGFRSSPGRTSQKGPLAPYHCGRLSISIEIPLGLGAAGPAGASALSMSRYCAALSAAVCGRRSAGIVDTPGRCFARRSPSAAPRRRRGNFPRQRAPNQSCGAVP